MRGRKLPRRLSPPEGPGGSTRPGPTQKTSRAQDPNLTRELGPLGKPGYSGVPGHLEAPGNPVNQETGAATGEEAVVAAPDGSAGGGLGGAVRVDLRDHRRERDRARRRLVLTRFSVLAGIVAVVLVVGWVFLFSPLFALRGENIEVTGAQSGLEAEARAVSEVYTGVALPRVPTSTISSELASNPLIATVDVERAWPHGLVITVSEREAVAQVKASGGYLIVGRDGISTGMSAEAVAGLPIIQVSSEDEERIQSQAVEAMTVLDSLPPSVRETVEEVSVTGLVVTLHLVGGSDVVWGDAEDSELKAQVLALLIEQRPSQTYDLTDPRQPVTS